MRNIFIINLLIVFFCVSACKKDIDTKIKIEGTWELKSSLQGLTGEITNYQPGNGNLMIFDKQNYQILSNGKLINSGVFKIVKGKSILSDKLVDKLVYNNDMNSIGMVVSVNNDELSLSIDAYDGPASGYRRIK